MDLDTTAVTGTILATRSLLAMATDTDRILLILVPHRCPVNSVS